MSGSIAKTDRNERRVRDHLHALGLRVERYFSGKQHHVLKSPDFKLFEGRRLVAFCEVKSVNSAQNAAGSTRDSDPTFNRLVKDVHTAAKQFEAVNPRGERMNILAFVNNDSVCGVDYLEDILTGAFTTDSGKTYNFFRRYSNGVIKDERLKIHLFIWMDLDETFYRVWSNPSPHVELLKRRFSIRGLKMPSNCAPHADVREASQARADGRGR